MYYPYDSTFLMLIPAFILALYAQFKVQHTYAKMSKIMNSKGLSGAEAGRRLLDDNGLQSVSIEHVPGNLTDHYDPRDKVLRLSAGVYDGFSVASLGIVAHEVGHAVQDAKAYAPLKIRSGLVPAAQFGSNLAIPFFFIGIIMSAPVLMDIGIVLFSVAVAFTLITLPVEFNASKRAVAMLSGSKMVTAEEAPMAKKVLDAAALTYVAATAMAVLNLIRLLALRGSRNN